MKASTVVLTFTDRQQLDRWLASPELSARLAEMEPLLDGDRTVNVVNGFGGWFHTAPAPPRWKQAAVVLLGLIAVSLLVTRARAAIAPSMPLVPSVVVGSVAHVLLLTWVVMPFFTRRFSGWLEATR